jgi:hypothetical protein
MTCFATIMALVLIALLAGHAGYLNAEVRRSRRRLDALAPKPTFSDLFFGRMDKMEGLINAVFAPQFVYLPAKPEFRMMTLAERRKIEEPCSGICPKCGEERSEWPAGVGFGTCWGCEEQERVQDLLHGGWLVGHLDTCRCPGCLRALKEFKHFMGYGA